MEDGGSAVISHTHTGKRHLHQEETANNYIMQDEPIKPAPSRDLKTAHTAQSGVSDLTVSLDPG